MFEKGINLQTNECYSLNGCEPFISDRFLSTKLNYYRMRTCQNAPWGIVVARHIDPDGVMMVIITWW